MDIKTRTAFQSGNLIGILVKASDLEELGEIQEIVIDVASGRIAYAVLRFGGFLGFAEKHFAVPWSEFRLVHAEAETYFLVDTTRAKLKKLKGFAADDWPEKASSKWDEMPAKEQDDEEDDDRV